MKPSILISCSCFARYKSTKEMAQRRRLQLCLMVKDNQNLPKEKHPKEKRPKVEVVMGMDRNGDGAGGEGGGDGNKGNGDAGDGGDGGDDPPDEEEEKDKEDEEEEAEKDSAAPPTPGPVSSSEPAWRAKGYCQDDKIQKRHQKEMRRVLAKKAVSALDAVQKSMPQEESVRHMQSFHEGQNQAAQEAFRAEAQRMRAAEEQGKRKEMLLRSIAAQKKKVEETNEEREKMQRDLLLQEELAEEEAKLIKEVEAAQPEEAKGPELQAVKLEPEDEPIEELKHLSFKVQNARRAKV
jgi:hypothetical protein